MKYTFISSLFLLTGLLLTLATPVKAQYSDYYYNRRVGTSTANMDLRYGGTYGQAGRDRYQYQQRGWNSSTPSRPYSSRSNSQRPLSENDCRILQDSNRILRGFGLSGVRVGDSNCQSY